jgi:metallophosphoesterase superfamily enzyme
MDKVLILTDIHITDGKKIIGLDPSERLRTALGQAARDHSDAAHLILMGDLVHFGSS